MSPSDWNRDALERLRRAILELDVCAYAGCGYVIYDADEYVKHLDAIHTEGGVA